MVDIYNSHNYKYSFINFLLKLKTLIPSKRVIKTFINNYKISKFYLSKFSKTAIGYTINPENTKDLVNWKEIMTTKNPYRIIYIRSNIVKGAISCMYIINYL